MGVRERKRFKKIKELVTNRDGLVCCFCNKELKPSEVTMEHIVPDSKKGTFNSTNLTVSCFECNNKRGDQPFFDYARNFDFDTIKIEKYKRLYFNNLKIKILNIAKEECLKDDWAAPVLIISQACLILKINIIDFSSYEETLQFEIKFSEICERRKIKYYFERLIKIIESDF